LTILKKAKEHVRLQLAKVIMFVAATAPDKIIDITIVFGEALTPQGIILFRDQIGLQVEYDLILH
jgi:hypothetical protein